MKEKRTIPLDERLYNTKANDLIYGYLLNKSTFYAGQRYISMSNFLSARLAYCDLKGMTTRTFTQAFKKLEEDGLIQWNGDFQNVGEAYLFTPCKGSDRYQLIDEEIIDTLIEADLLHGIKIYTYLLNKIIYHGPGNFVFTFKRITEELGWAATNSRARKLVGEIIEKIRDLGLINYEHFFWTGSTQTAQPVKKLRLTYVRSP